MHPALISVLIAEHERELARRTRHAWQRPQARSVRSSSRGFRPAQRLARGLARGVAFFS
jgi:hypothetical protein